MEKKCDYNKVRKLLGKDYHLYEEFKNDDVKWTLYRKYDDPKTYFSKDNKPIMTSETNTYGDLLEYAKKHKKYDCINILFKTSIYLSVFALLLCIVNCYINSEMIRGFIFGMNLVIMITVLILDITVNKNFKVEMLELAEMIDRY